MYIQSAKLHLYWTGPNISIDEEKNLKNQINSLILLEHSVSESLKRLPGEGKFLRNRLDRVLIKPSEEESPTASQPFYSVVMKIDDLRGLMIIPIITRFDNLSSQGKEIYKDEQVIPIGISTLFDGEVYRIDLAFENDNILITPLALEKVTNIANMTDRVTIAQLRYIRQKQEEGKPAPTPVELYIIRNTVINGQYYD